MRDRGRLLPTLVGLLLLTAACGDAGPAPREPGEERDPDGRPGRAVSSAERDGGARRIVSLVPAATATIGALGAEDRLVGRTDFDTAAALADVPSVGGGIRPDLERLLSLEPDLVIVFRGESDARTPQRLREAGVGILAVRPDDVGDVLAMVRLLGRTVGRERAADSLAGSLERRLAEVRGRVGGRSRRRVAFLVGGAPPWAAGPGTFVHELLTAAGGENVFGDLDGLYGSVSTEALVARRPELLLLPDGTPPPEDTGGVPIVRVPSWVTLPGPSLARSADTLARILHPGASP